MAADNLDYAAAAGAVVLDNRTGARGDVAQWVEVFTRVWATPRERLDDLMALLSPEIVLRAPTRPPESRGQAAGRRAFERAFRAMPDLRAVIHRWSAAEDVAFIEMTFHATIGGRKAAWDSVDRILFRDGLAVERVAYFDPAKVQSAFLRNPTAILQMLRLRTGM